MENEMTNLGLITWENVFGGRDCTGQYNAQIELCGDGNFITRSNNVERVYRRVNPDDWDGDGLANEIDPNPMAYDGDLFGTGVAWLNANCGSVLSASADTNGEIVVSWHTNVCGAAYYWLQFTAQRDSTRIVIDCEGESTLGDLFVVANSNQVCKVPLLMGPDYHVTASHPVADVSASDAEAEVRPASRDVSGGDFNVKRGVEHGVPVRMAKLGNFLAGYGTKRLGVWSASRWLSQSIGTDNDETADMSWAAGGDVADGSNVVATVSVLSTNMWHSADVKVKTLWPNPATTDNHSVGPVSVDYNWFFRSPRVIEEAVPRP